MRSLVRAIRSNDAFPLFLEHFLSHRGDLGLVEVRSQQQWSLVKSDLLNVPWLGLDLRWGLCSRWAVFEMVEVMLDSVCERERRVCGGG
jgi:hypothetical protein